METEVYKKIYKLQKNGWWFGNARNKLVIALIKSLKLNKPRILDIGPSEGAFLDYLDKNNFNFTAIDIDINAITFCRERGFGDRIRYGSLLEIPFEEKKFDIVTALDIIEHVDDDLKAISEINRVLGDKGYTVIIVPAFQWLWSVNDEKYHHYRRYGKKEIIEKLEGKYFNVEYCGYFNFFLFPVFMLMVLYAKMFPKKIKASSTLKPVPGFLNGILAQVMAIENWFIRHRMKLPAGSSIVIIAKKNDYGL